MKKKAGNPWDPWTILPFCAHFINRSRSIKQIQEENSRNTSICRWFGDTSPLDPVVPLYWICFLAKNTVQVPRFFLPGVGHPISIASHLHCGVLQQMWVLHMYLGWVHGWIGLNGWTSWLKSAMVCPSEIRKMVLVQLERVSYIKWRFFFGGDDSSGRLDLHFAKRFTEGDVQHNLLAPGNGSTDSWHQKRGKVVGMCLVWKILTSIIFCSQADQSSCEDNVYIYVPLPNNFQDAFHKCWCFYIL